MVSCLTAASMSHSVGAKSIQEPAKQLQHMQELSDEAIKALLSVLVFTRYINAILAWPNSKTRRHKKSRSAGKHSGTSPLLRQVLRRSLLGQIGKHQLKAEKC
ncbi:hypothetical protein KVV02_001765 [Mortierella alpina]|uniref:Uncharacterized protein n=1 Tax=Mortierella alpina TaxID=64518 RepID=A0A9P7ZYB1_MORAP|nr:hypothetical protein KVV02_001765 [Mortierella alpina]